VTAGMDLALALVEEDLGRATALEVARWLVLFVKRPGGQAQFSAQLRAQMAEREPLRDLQEWIPDNLAADLSVPALARRACMSERNFARAFRRETGGLPVDAVARQAGFGTVETMRHEGVPEPDAVLVPGGLGTYDALEDERLVAWIRHAHETSDWTTSVCTGSLLLAAAGVLDDLEATTHWLDLEALERLGARPTGRRVVEQGKVVTAAGVSSGIDMGLVLAARIAGPEVAQAIQLAIEYDPQPPFDSSSDVCSSDLPFDSGSTEKAPPEIVDLVRSVAAARAD
jgi:transcriptional regulator GlxA family with amidase domain